MKTTDLTGIVVAGGKSRRMGSEKGLIPFNGKPLIVYPIEILGKVCNQVLISANSRSFDFLNLPVIADYTKEGGPMTGICSALLASSTEYNIVLSCDMPLISQNLLNHLIVSAGEGNATIAWHEGYAQPLCGVYNRSLTDELQYHIRERKFKLSEFLEKIDAQFIIVDKSLPFYHPNLFLNINSISDLENGQRFIGL